MADVNQSNFSLQKLASKWHMCHYECSIIDSRFETCSIYCWNFFIHTFDVVRFKHVWIKSNPSTSCLKIAVCSYLFDVQNVLIAVVFAFTFIWTEWIASTNMNDAASHWNDLERTTYIKRRKRQWIYNLVISYTTIYSAMDVKVQGY